MLAFPVFINVRSNFRELVLVVIREQIAKVRLGILLEMLENFGKYTLKCVSSSKYPQKYAILVKMPLQ